RRGVEWYRAQFDPEATIRGESSPNYTAYPLFRGVPKRMHSVVPDAKLIYLVRDPLERIGAHWVHNYAHGRIDDDLAVVMRYSRRRYLARSRYHMQLRRFLRRYPLERILVLDQSDLRHRRPETMRRVFEFAGVDPGFSHPLFRRERHKTGRKRRLTLLGGSLEARRERSRRALLPDRAWAFVRNRWPLGRPIEVPDVRDAMPDDALEVLRRDAERLRELTGRGFEHWSIWEA
ncbi:MAG TPA: sulfotransferase, partial [Solirubrobacterales bacterium]|nr:sulfotransferase [Solirubrobacterales bacterium]